MEHTSAFFSSPDISPVTLFPSIFYLIPILDFYSLNVMVFFLSLSFISPTRRRYYLCCVFLYLFSLLNDSCFLDCRASRASRASPVSSPSSAAESSLTTRLINRLSDDRSVLDSAQNTYTLDSPPPWPVSFSLHYTQAEPLDRMGEQLSSSRWPALAVIAAEPLWKAQVDDWAIWKSL